ncbi:hypothetical protein [Rhizobium sp. CAU 1783]
MARLPTTIPAAAKHLLAFIGGIEAPQGHDTIYGNNQHKLPRPLTTMTIGEIVDAQKSWTRRFKSSAAGHYQFMRATLQGLAKEYSADIDGSTVFTADIQDRLGYALLLRRGFDEFISRRIGRVEFAKRLAQEWASLPVLADCQGSERQVTRGQSYYAGDGLNKSLVKPAAVEAALERALFLASQDDVQAAPTPAKVEPAAPAPSSAPVTLERKPVTGNWRDVLVTVLSKLFGGKS